MAEFLLELLCEEIPARMQKPAAADLAERLDKALDAHALAHQIPLSFVTPRRLTVMVTGLPHTQEDRIEEKRGPRVGAPDQAIQGFLAANHLTQLDQCAIRTVKGQAYHFACLKKPGQSTAQVLAEILPSVLDTVAWPKSMRWNAPGSRWIRPLRGLLCLFDGKRLPITYAGLQSGTRSHGHRIHAPKAFRVVDYADYQARLKAANVILDSADREARIRQIATNLATQNHLTLVEDNALIEEIAGLVEWPVAVIGDFDASYLDLPPPVLTAEMRSHQKYLSLHDASGALAPHFIVIANLEARDGGKTIRDGNARVLRARLADARFFWDQDRKQSLESRLPMLAGRIFHARLGHMEDKSRRIAHLARALAAFIPEADPALAERAGRLAKADLSSKMVGEFPELQGIMGGYYARHDGEPEEVATAISNHYAPLGPDGPCPTEPVAIAVALADKMDTLAGFFSIGAIPTGSKDPYALRRAALGVVRIIFENRLRLPLRKVLALTELANPSTIQSLASFFNERLRLYLREHGFRHDRIAAVLATGEDDMTRLADRLRALDHFLASPDGANLLTAYARARNIVTIEEKRDQADYDHPPDPHQCTRIEEKDLLKSLAEAEQNCQKASQQEEFPKVMSILAGLRSPVDAFFDHVTVNSDDPAKRINRLRILARIRTILDQVAAFSELQD